MTTEAGPRQRRASVAVDVGGVTVGGGAPVVVQSMTNTDTADVEATEQQVAELAQAGSEIVRVTNKYSSNMMARSLVLAIAAEMNGTPATAAAGEATIVGWLKTRGLEFPELVIGNGSGLSREARISADSMARLLVGAREGRYAPEFLTSLSLGGLDGTLQDRLSAAQGPFSPEVLLPWMEQIARALDHLNSPRHLLGSRKVTLLHCNVRPASILCVEDGSDVLLGNFTRARILEDAGDLHDVAHDFPGPYAAPELRDGRLERGSDQYSLAILYQEMLTGTLPFGGSNAAELTLQHLNDEPDISALSPADRYAVSRALAKDPLCRYATCREFVDSLSKAEVAGATSPGVKVSVSFAASGQVSQPSPRQNTQTDFFDDEPATASNAAPEHRFIRALQLHDEELSVHWNRLEVASVWKCEIGVEFKTALRESSEDPNDLLFREQLNGLVDRCHAPPPEYRR